MTGPMLMLQEVTRTFGSGDAAVHALRGVSLQVLPGELVAVMGPSGSGKSTLLNVAGGLDYVDTGVVEVDGRDLGRLSPAALQQIRRRTMGFVFQDLNLIPSLTLLENVSLPLELDGARLSVARCAARDSLAGVGIDHLADRFPDEVSGGQRQRAAIARSLVGDRSLVLADEPTGALDSTSGEAVLRVLRARCDAGAAALLVTHESRHAAWADRVVFLRDGLVIDSTGRPMDAESLLPQAN
ncbi:ABC transporter ATP-binding protein [Branchiibius sp. NY16-3462-2]|uniref:ABC transporter ATP-binding protein n=1 Tax=Branchiibius sp. NY16-3462-2 TaxID=1807500 RepID=UPI000B2CF58D|nr:ABC transporter ATP-binding protein [Branchiibius sp. NY16-3462-2]